MALVELLACLKQSRAHLETTLQAITSMSGRPHVPYSIAVQKSGTLDMQHGRSNTAHTLEGRVRLSTGQ